MWRRVEQYTYGYINEIVKSLLVSFIKANATRIYKSTAGLFIMIIVIYDFPGP